MYETTIKGEALFQAKSYGYGREITSFGTTEQGETPVSLLNIALASCVTMCVQGYYASQEGKPSMPVEVRSCLEERRVELLIGVGEQVSEDKQAAILAYVEQKCRVKALLKDDLAYHISFISL